MPPYNPMTDFYLRQAQPYQQQFNFPTHQPMLPPINSKFVTNVEEAKASMVDGVSYNLFLDSSCGKIYLKKLGNNGMSDFFTYTIEEQKPDVDPLEQINSRLSRIENYIGGLSNESVPNDAGCRQPEPVPQPTVTEPYAINDETKSAGIPENARNDKWKERNRH